MKEKQERDEKVEEFDGKLKRISVELSEQKSQRAVTEESLKKQLKEKEVEMLIIQKDYDQKIAVYKDTLESSNLIGGLSGSALRFSTDFKSSGLSNFNAD